MESIYILIPVTFIFLVLAVGIWFWAVGNGQYDDLDKAANSILFDDDPSPTKTPPDAQSSASGPASDGLRRAD